MRITRIINTGMIGGLIAAGVFSCKKAPYQEIQDVPKYTSEKIDLIKYKTGKILKDSSYSFYGYDTVEINRDFYSNQHEFLKSLTKTAIEKTPKTQIGKHIKIQMIPKRGGGFDQIPTWEKDYKPNYKDQKVVVKSDKVYTTDGEDMYIPIEYYGRKNQ
jgi:hypothetical protein